MGDNAKATLTFLNQSGAAVGTPIALGPVTPADRAGSTGMFPRSVPVGARSARVTLDFARTAGDSNVGYADDIVFALGSGSGTGGTGGGTGSGANAEGTPD